VVGTGWSGRRWLVPATLLPTTDKKAGSVGPLRELGLG